MIKHGAFMYMYLGSFSLYEDSRPPKVDLEWGPGLATVLSLE